MIDVELNDLLGQIQSSAPGGANHSQQFRIAGCPVLIRFGSDEVSRLLSRSIRHLRCRFSTPPALTIDCWSADPDARLVDPFVGWPVEGNTYCERRSFHLSWDAPHGPLVIYRRDQPHAWMRFRSLDCIQNWDVAHPFRKIIHWWAADRSLQLVHAAAVGHAAGAILLVGPSGSGKSTTALAAMSAGFKSAGDDSVLVENGAYAKVHSLYLSAGVNQHTANLLPSLREAFQSSPLIGVQEKRIVFADEIYPESIALKLPLVGIVMPMFGTTESSMLHPVTPAAVLRSLAPSTILQLPGMKASRLAFLSELVRSLPCWKLELGTNPVLAVDSLRVLLDR